MIGTYGISAQLLVAGYLLLFFLGGIMAAREAGRPVWLFGMARGRDRLAAAGFRAAFLLVLAGPWLWQAWPGLSAGDPIWRTGGHPLAGAAGVMLAGMGGMLAFAAQMSMGASWRVGVARDETGALVSGGLYRFSRNPTFLGQSLLLSGLALALPSLPTLAGAILMVLSARTQIRSEEAALHHAIGPAYEAYRRRVPRWIGPVRD